LRSIKLFFKHYNSTKNHTVVFAEFFEITIPKTFNNARLGREIPKLPLSGIYLSGL